MVSSYTPNDTGNFIDSLGRSIASLPPDWANLLDSQRELIVTRAPGRLDLMGGIADYSGSLVLQWPIESAVHVALQRQEAAKLRIASMPEKANGPARLFEIELDDLLASDYATARARLASNADEHWAAYVAGAFPILMRERNASFHEGAQILLRSDVPEGKGVASSAALEVASMQAISKAYGLPLNPVELALLCQKVENLIVGAPCGVMDQMTAAAGELNRLLELRCQPAELQGTIPLPAGVAVWGIDSGIRHSVGGADYRTVRTAAFMGYRIIADRARLAAQAVDDSGHLAIEDPEWKGYLANITPEEFEREYAAHLPEEIRGEDFLARYGGITDKVSSVAHALSYPVLSATRHPIYENARVMAFARLLRNWQGDDDSVKLGSLMYESHQSYSSCGLGSDGTDLLVALTREALNNGLYGAKITGGGSGGTVAILGRRSADEAVRRIASQYGERTGYQAVIISGSSPGASSFGSLRIESFAAAV